jgi:CRP/FNR family transcriptional regulator, cyclic AMP receptor protein
MTVTTEEPVEGSFLAQLRPSDREALRAAGTERGYRTGTVLFHQGDPSRHVLILLSGWVKAAASSRQGWEALLAIRGAGDIVGELSALDGQPRLATVTTLAPVSALLLSNDRLDACMADNWPIAGALLRHLAGNLRESDRRRIQFGGSNGDTRLIVLLHELSVRHGRQTDEGVLVDLPLSQRELAASVGVSREVAARTLRLLRTRSIVVTRRRQIVVVRPDLLKSLAGSVSLSTDRG